MADEPEDPDAAADRIEAALERIARLAAVPPAPVSAASLAPAPLSAAPSSAAASSAASPESDLSVSEIAERLDSLIGRLRAALGKTE